jgi:hypothetical protein
MFDTNHWNERRKLWSIKHKEILRMNQNQINQQTFEPIDVDLITADESVQPRVRIDQNYVNELKQLIADGVELPPPVVFYDGSKHWLGEGFHRLAAYKSLEKTTVTVDVRKGGKREATLFAAGANGHHGKRMTNADKMRVVDTLIKDREWSKWSDHEVARHCGVSQSFVSARKRKLTKHGIQSPTLRKTKSGRIIETKNIGKRKKKLDQISNSSSNGVSPQGQHSKMEENLNKLVEMASSQKRLNDQLRKEENTPASGAESAPSEEVSESEPSDDSGKVKNSAPKNPSVEDLMKQLAEKDARISELEKEVETLKAENLVLKARVQDHKEHVSEDVVYDA